MFHQTGKGKGYNIMIDQVNSMCRLWPRVTFVWSKLVSFFKLIKLKDPWWGGRHVPLDTSHIVTADIWLEEGRKHPHYLRFNNLRHSAKIGLRCYSRACILCRTTLIRSIVWFAYYALCREAGIQSGMLRVIHDAELCCWFISQDHLSQWSIVFWSIIKIEYQSVTKISKVFS
jgi:hypothetical protein